ncbi:unnamed protein product [Discosporangium mesarthrocarpum]
MQGPMAEHSLLIETVHLARDFLVWIRRRLSILFLVILTWLVCPFVLVQGFIFSLLGREYFSDPNEKHSFVSFAFNIFASMKNNLLLTELPPSPEALMAAQNRTVTESGGVVVTLMEDHLRFEPHSVPPKVKTGEVIGVSRPDLAQRIRTFDYSERQYLKVAKNQRFCLVEEGNRGS